ncbi:hypothetical protein CBS101457_001614 [Exobasidium rhododendri]|nr:hypothetical protein CBS101457_001614 [Exobasidium rhododendri]
MRFFALLRKKDRSGATPDQVERKINHHSNVNDQERIKRAASGRARSATESQVAPDLPPKAPAQRLFSDYPSSGTGRKKRLSSEFIASPAHLIQKKDSPLAMPRPDNLVSSSLVTSSQSGQWNPRRKQEEHNALLDNNTTVGQECDLASPSEQLPGSVQLDPPPFSSRAHRLFRSTSGKFKEKKSWIGAHRNQDLDDGGLEASIGRSLGDNSNVSIASVSSLSASRSHRNQLDTHLANREHPPTSATSSAFRRVRVASNASIKDALALLPGSPSFSKTSPGNGVTEGVRASELPPTPPLSGTGIGAIHFMSSNEKDEAIPPSPSRWKRGTSKSTRPSTASGVIPTPSLQSYLEQLSPSPRGLATYDREGRRALICQYVHRKQFEEIRDKGRSKISVANNLKSPLSPSSSAPSLFPSPLKSMDSLIEDLETELHLFMEDDIRHGTESQRYKELLLAEVFIEARRSLGVDSADHRLHAIFDLDAHLFPVDTFEKDGEIRPVTTNSTASDSTTHTTAMSPSTTSPSFSWELGHRHSARSLTPAPRKRRPKTAPIDGRKVIQDDMDATTTRTLIDQGTNSWTEVKEQRAPMPERSYSGHASMFPSQSCSSMEGDLRDYQNQILTPAVFSSKCSQKPLSLPPSPPRSTEGHSLAHTEESNNRAEIMSPTPVYMKHSKAPSSNRSSAKSDCAPTAPVFSEIMAVAKVSELM